MPLGSIDGSHTNVPKHLDLWSVVGQRTSGRSAGPGEHGRLGRFIGAARGRACSPRPQRLPREKSESLGTLVSSPLLATVVSVGRSNDLSRQASADRR